MLVTGELVVRPAAIPHVARPSLPPFVTLSGGVARWSPGSPLSLMKVVAEADAALFQAKSAGRNCIREAASCHHDRVEPSTVGG